MNDFYVRSVDADDWIVTKQYKYKNILIPVGFVFDGDSVPRLPLLYWRLKNRARRAALVHDWLYYKQSCSRKKADDIFLEAMAEEHLPRRHRWPIYLGVRLFGWWAWNKNKKENGT